MSNETPAAARADALGYVEQTINTNKGSSDAVTWRNAEVLVMLAEIAERLCVHSGESCEVCLHNGAQYCGCYDGACCRESVDPGRDA